MEKNIGFFFTANHELLPQKYLENPVSSTVQLLINDQMR